MNRLLGEDHPQTLQAINDLGILHRKQQHYEIAEKFLTDAHERRITKLGDEHPRTLQSKHELALLYKQQKLYDKAEPMLSEAAKGRLDKLGDIHPHTQESINALIELYDACNKPEIAQEWREKVTQVEDLQE